MPSKCCDFCNCPLEPVYTVPDSPQGMVVYLCRACGLVQSLPTKPKPPGRTVSLSSGPDWGNVRHGKGLRLAKAKEVLAPHLEGVEAVLDVGSNRGDFVRWVVGAAPDLKQVQAVEPDRDLVDYWDAPKTLVHTCRFEDVTWTESRYDLVYACHTLEHADSAAEMLNGMVRCLKPGGLLYLDVPNLFGIFSKDNVEEFFIDKHRFHFTHDVLYDRLDSMKLYPLLCQGRPMDNLLNITMLWQKRTAELSETFMNGALSKQYPTILTANRAKLKAVAARLNERMKRQRVAIWGAGRILDALVQYGGLGLEACWGLVDDGLEKAKIYKAHDRPVFPSGAIEQTLPPVGLVVVLARSSAAEIVAKAKEYGVPEVVTWAELMEEQP